MSEHHAFLLEIRSPELRQEIRTVLLQLVMLGEAPALSMEPSVSHGKSEDAAPRGAFGRVEDRSLWESYCAHFRKASPDEDRLKATLERAKLDLRSHTHRLDEDRITLQQERSEAADIQLLLEYGEGKSAGFMAARHQWPIGWVRTVRERNGRDPEKGHARPRWRETPDEERYAICERLRDEGLSQTDAAARLGIAKSTINPYWPRHLRRVA